MPTSGLTRLGLCRVIRRQDRILLLMTGFHGIEDARQATQSFDEFARQIPGLFELVVDLSKLDGYEPASRLHWLPILKESSARIRCLTLIGGSGLLRMTASAICLYAGLRMRSMASLEDVLSERSEAVRKQAASQ